MSIDLTRLEQILSNIDTPSRYIGAEANSVHKPDEALTSKMALVFPDTYEVGMSNNAIKILYHVINRESDLLAETSFAPWFDMYDAMKTANIPLYTHQSYRALSEFDAVGISLQTELNFTNVPMVLELGGISAFSKDRTDADPIIIAGGPSMANPEPVADFFDVIVIGDGEEITPTLLRLIGTMKKSGKNRKEVLQKLSTYTGVYIPEFLATTTSRLGEQVPESPASGTFEKANGIRRTWIENLNTKLYPTRNLVPNTQPVHSRYAVEVMRGCTQGCRFCQAGYWYRPIREMDVDDVVDLALEGIKATGEGELGLLSLSTADYGQIEPLTDSLIDRHEFHNTSISLPSLRVNSYGKELSYKVEAISTGRSVTFAPETGSERLRKLINKTITNQDMYSAADNIFQGNYNKIKLYTMIGLPTETMEDMEEFCELIENLVTIGKKYKQHFTIQASIGILVPKSFTPMQWSGFISKDDALDRIHFIKNRFQKNRRVKITWSSWETARLESFYSRGDRTDSALIYKAYQKGLIFESHNERMSIDIWEEIWNEVNYNEKRIYSERILGDVLPWDFIHPGVSRKYLEKEYKKMFLTQSASVPNCRDNACQGCGVPGNFSEMKFSEAPQKYAAPSRTKDEIISLVTSRKETPEDVYFYQVIFSKTGMARFLPHQQTIKFIEKAFLRMNAPVRYSKGFHRRPIIHNSGALPLGLHSKCERVVIDFTAALAVTESWLKELNSVFPDGLEITSIIQQENKKMKPAQEVTYTFHGTFDGAAIQERWINQTLQPVTNHKGKILPIQTEINGIDIKNNTLTIHVKTNEYGNSISPYAIFAGLLEITYDEARTYPFCKESVS